MHGAPSCYLYCVTPARQWRIQEIWRVGGGGGGGGFTNGGKYIRQLGGVGEHCKPRHRGVWGGAPKALQVIITAFQNHMEFQYFLLTTKIVHVYAHASASWVRMGGGGGGGGGGGSGEPW